MSNIIITLGWVGWIIGAVCLFGFLYQRDLNRDREKREAAERDKTDKRDS